MAMQHFLLAVLMFFFGAALASFFDVLTDPNRLRKRRSYCPHCRETLRWYEMIPLLSYLRQAGKCRSCGKKIAFQHFFGEFMGGLIFLSVFLTVFLGLGFGGRRMDPWNMSALVYSSLVFGYFALFLLISFADTKTFLVSLSWLLGLNALALLLLFFPQHPSSAFVSLAAGMAAGGLLSLVSFFHGWKKLGEADIFIVVSMGFVLGFAGVAAGLISASVSGIIICFARKWGGSVTDIYRMKLPFAPLLLLGTIFGLFFTRFF